MMASRLLCGVHSNEACVVSGTDRPGVRFKDNDSYGSCNRKRLPLGSFDAWVTAGCQTCTLQQLGGELTLLNQLRDVVLHNALRTLISRLHSNIGNGVRQLQPDG